MKFLFYLLALIPLTVFAQETPIDWSPIFDFISGLAPWVSYVLSGLGTIVVVGTAVDSMVPDEKDKGFMKKILAIPILGGLLSSLTRFSPFNIKDK